MRGQYRIVLNATVGTTEAPILTFIVPSNTLIKPASIHIIGGAGAPASVFWRLRRITIGTPNVTGSVVVKPVNHNNTIPTSITFGTGWLAAPGGYDEAVAAGRLEAFGGRDTTFDNPREEVAQLGTAGADTRFELSAQSAVASTLITLRLTFDE